MADTRIDPFGYRPAVNPYPVAGLTVGEAKHAGTLEPYVSIKLRPNDFVTDPVLLALPLELAEQLRDELTRWTDRARERHWDPGSGRG